MLGIIILNYNTYQDSANLVNSLQHQTIAIQCKMVLVDNHSPNDSFEKLKPLENKYKNVVVLQTESNLGYAKGNNFGLKYLEEHVQPQYVAILNNDVSLPQDCFEKLINKYEILDEPAIIAPKQLDAQNKEILPYKMNSFLDDCLNLFFIFKIFHKRNELQFKDTTGLGAMKVDMIPGSFMFTSFNRFKQMNYFYPNTFLYVEERFIAVSTLKKGWNNYIIIDQTYVHKHAKTINTFHTQINKFRMLYKGWLEFTRKCRKHGALKARVLKPLMVLSLFEMTILNRIKLLFKR